MTNLFTEKKQYYLARFKTTEGLWDLFIGSAIWGFIIINYKDFIYNHILNLLNFLPKGFILDYFSYLLFGIILTPLGLIITYILTKLFRKLFKNNKII